MDPLYDPIIRTILGRFVGSPAQAARHSRATLVLDVTLSALAEPLREARFIVIVGDDLADYQRRREVLSGRVLITENSTDCIDDAPVMEFGIVGLDAMPWSASAVPFRENEVARMISNAVIY